MFNFIKRLFSGCATRNVSQAQQPQGLLYPLPPTRRLSGCTKYPGLPYGLPVLRYLRSLRKPSVSQKLFPQRSPYRPKYVRHHMSAKHLHRYVNEFATRQNMLGTPPMDVFSDTIRMMVDKRLTHKQLMA